MKSKYRINLFIENVIFETVYEGNAPYLAAVRARKELARNLGCFSYEIEIELVAI